MGKLLGAIYHTPIRPQSEIFRWWIWITTINGKLAWITDQIRWCRGKKWTDLIIQRSGSRTQRSRTGKKRVHWYESGEAERDCRSFARGSFCIMAWSGIRTSCNQESASGSSRNLRIAGLWNQGAESHWLFTRSHETICHQKVNFRIRMQLPEILSPRDISGDWLWI